MSQYDGNSQFFGSGVYMNGRIFLIGGVSPFFFERLSRIKTATLSTTTNSVGPWSNATSSLPAPLWKFGLATNGNYIYTVGGMDNNYAPTNVVYFTQVDSNGNMQSWQSTTPLPANRVSANVYVFNGKLYAVGGRSQEWTATNTSSVFSATINNDGTLGAWQQGADLPFAFNNTTNTGSVAHVVDGYLYLLGAGPSGKNVKYTQLQGDGSFGTWLDGPSLMQGVGSQTTLYNNNLYALGVYANTNDVQFINIDQLKKAGGTSGTTSLSFFVDNTIPEISSTGVDGINLTLSYSKTLNSTAPATSSFAITVNGLSATSTAVSISQNAVHITLQDPVFANQAVLLSYDASSTNPIQDTLGHTAVGLLNQPVANNVVVGCSTSTYKVDRTTYISVCGSTSVLSVDPEIVPKVVSSSAQVSSSQVSVVPLVPTVASSTVLSINSTNTTAVVNQLSPISSYRFETSLSYGNSGKNVLNLQLFLQNQGLLKVSPNGHFGPATRAALAQFQKSKNISPAVGYFGPITRNVIKNLQSKGI